MAQSSRLRMLALVGAAISLSVAQSTTGSATSTNTSPPHSGTTITASSTASPTHSGPATMASSTTTPFWAMPSSNDSAPGSTSTGSSGSSGGQPSGLVNYYFIFIAIILCIVGLLGFFFWRRKRRARDQLQAGRQHALAQDLTSWDPARSRRRYWQGRRRSAEASREEGLDENGEAPPPYIPKAQGEGSEACESGDGVPAIPLQTLSREDAGLKPPEYESAPLHPPAFAARRPSADAANGSNTP